MKEPTEIPREALVEEETTIMYTNVCVCQVQNFSFFSLSFRFFCYGGWLPRREQGETKGSKKGIEEIGGRRRKTEDTMEKSMPRKVIVCVSDERMKWEEDDRKGRPNERNIGTLFHLTMFSFKSPVLAGPTYVL